MLDRNYVAKSKARDRTTSNQMSEVHHFIDKAVLPPVRVHDYPPYLPTEGRHASARVGRSYASSTLLAA